MSNVVCNFNLDNLFNTIPEALEVVMTNVEGYIDDSERTPYFTGATQKSKKHEVKSNIAKLSYNTDYASDIYTDVGRRFSKKHNSNAQARWIESPIIFEEAASDLAEEMKKRGGS